MNNKLELIISKVILLNHYTWILLLSVSLFQSFGSKKRITSRLLSCNSIWRNAFVMSLIMTYFSIQNLNNSLTSWGVEPHFMVLLTINPFLNFAELFITALDFCCSFIWSIYCLVWNVACNEIFLLFCINYFNDVVFQLLIGLNFIFPF